MRRGVVHEEHQQVEVPLDALLVLEDLHVGHVIHEVANQGLKEYHLARSEHAAPAVIGFEAVRCTQTLAADRSFYLVPVAEPRDATPVNSEPLIEVLKILTREALLVDVLVVQEHRLGVAVLDLAKEILVLEVHARLRMVVHLCSLYRVVEEVLEFVVGGI